MKIISVALVDDEILFREGFKLLLNNFTGIKVCFEAQNGIELLNWFEHCSRAKSA